MSTPSDKDIDELAAIIQAQFERSKGQEQEQENEQDQGQDQEQEDSASASATATGTSSSTTESKPTLKKRNEKQKADATRTPRRNKSRQNGPPFSFEKALASILDGGHLTRANMSIADAPLVYRSQMLSSALFAVYEHWYKYFRIEWICRKEVRKSHADVMKAINEIKGSEEDVLQARVNLCSRIYSALFLDIDMSGVHKLVQEGTRDSSVLGKAFLNSPFRIRTPAEITALFLKELRINTSGQYAVDAFESVRLFFSSYLATIEQLTADYKKRVFSIEDYLNRLNYLVEFESIIDAFDSKQKPLPELISQYQDKVHELIQEIAQSEILDPKVILERVKDDKVASLATCARQKSAQWINDTSTRISDFMDKMLTTPMLIPFVRTLPSFMSHLSHFVDYLTDKDNMIKYSFYSKKNVLNRACTIQSDADADADENVEYIDAEPAPASE